MKDPKIQICAVTKGKSIPEIEFLIRNNPHIKIIAENRWPDCEEKFKHFHKLEKHFIGPLQSNKVNKVVPLVDVIQSVDSIKLIKKIDQAAKDFQKTISFCFQVNISHDPQKQGIKPQDLPEIIEEYKSLKLKHTKLIGLMTIGAQTEMRKRQKYFQEFKSLFDQINQKLFPQSHLKILSMGMSQDYQLAIEAGATMVRLGTILFQ